MATKREEAQKRRAEDRRRRRGSGSSGSDEPTQDGPGTEEPLDTVKQAAKVAAAAAAVGAAMGAARAMTGSGGDDKEAQAPPEPEQPEGDAEQEEAREPRAEEQHEPEEQHEAEEQREPEAAEEPEEERRPSGARPEEARRVVAAAREQLAALLGKQADSVSGLERTDHGWVVTLDVVELARIPESTDVLASYELELDGDRNLVRYSRGRRFYRSEADDGELP